MLEFTNIGEYEKFKKNTRKQLWLHLKLQVFKINNFDYFGVFVCEECESMATIKGLSPVQEPETIRVRMCFHSSVVSMLVGNWRTEWTISMSPTDHHFNVVPSHDVQYETFVHIALEAFLAAICNDNGVSLLYCVTKRQESPYCSRCVVRKCHHYVGYLSLVKEALESIDVAGGIIADEEDVYEPLPDIDEEDIEYNDHYMKKPPDHIRGHIYGYNYEPIAYPFSENKSYQKLWLERVAGVVNLPRRLLPKFDVCKRCKHNVSFNANEEALSLDSQNVSVFNDYGQRIFETQVYARPTVGTCRCLQRYDGSDMLLWHLGKGRFVDYTLLVSYLHKWKSSGLSIHALHRSVIDGAKSFGITCSLTYGDLHRSICGFFSNLEFNVEKAFSCPKHKTSPKWIVADGKAVGPLKRRVSHIKELDIADDDTNVLVQSTSFKDRLFLSFKKERTAVCKLITEETSLEEFVQNEDLVSENGLMVKSLVSHILEKNSAKIPGPYVKLLSNISKPSSVRTLTQGTDLEILERLAEFCKGQLDLRIVENEENLRDISRMLPVLWPILDSICKLEESDFLPLQVSQIVIKMLKIRFETFQNAAKRSNSNYFLWPDKNLEHPTQCYPTMPLWRFPSRYEVSGLKDGDLCEKTFTYHSDFCAGVFTVGCGCSSNITFGFELMLAKESPRNLFRFVMCRDIDEIALDGILVDFACLFEPYMMNREASFLENKNVLVDGVHWQGHKRLKKGDKAGKGGHLGYVYQPLIF